MKETIDKVMKQIRDKYNSECPKCHALFNCDVKSGKGVCWCFYEKAGKSLTNMVHQDCLCKKCLGEP